MTKGRWKIYNEDAVEWAKNYEKSKFHALLCDPPYHLTSIVKRFGKNGSAPAKYGTDGVFARSSAGFMGQQWDGGDVAFQPETWAAFAQVLHPGAFIMAFSSSRSWHRLATAIEDAGYILHPSIFLWAQGQGFPKATRVKGQKEFEGHRYGLQALKPAVEPIIVAQLPYDGKPVESMARTGAGALNVDGGRIGISGGGTHCNNRDADGNCLGHNNAGRSTSGETIHSKLDMTKDQGRWPANFILDESSAELLDVQTGNLGGGGTHCNINFVQSRPEYTPYDDTLNGGGGASRFFYTVSSALDKSDPVYYCAKVSNKERNAGLDDKNPHPTLKPLDLCKYLATLLLPPDNYAPRRILIPFSGSGSEMIGAGLAGWEQIVGVEFDTENGYTDIAKARLEHWLK